MKLLSLAREFFQRSPLVGSSSLICLLGLAVLVVPYVVTVWGKEGVDPLPLDGGIVTTGQIIAVIGALSVFVTAGVETWSKRKGMVSRKMVELREQRVFHYSSFKGHGVPDDQRDKAIEDYLGAVAKVCQESKRPGSDVLAALFVLEDSPITPRHAKRRYVGQTTDCKIKAPPDSLYSGDDGPGRAFHRLSRMIATEGRIEAYEQLVGANSTIDTNEVFRYSAEDIEDEAQRDYINKQKIKSIICVPVWATDLEIESADGKKKWVYSRHDSVKDHAAPLVGLLCIYTHGEVTKARFDVDRKHYARAAAFLGFMCAESIAVKDLHLSRREHEVAHGKGAMGLKNVVVPTPDPKLDSVVGSAHDPRP